MQLTTVREIYKNREAFLDKEITVGGWVRSVRDSKTFGFIVLHDGTFFETLQVVYHDSMENFAEISKLNIDYIDFADKLTKAGSDMGLQVHVMHEDIFNAMHRI